jgi:trans-aconitate methyltransferase
MKNRTLLSSEEIRLHAQHIKKQEYEAAQRILSKGSARLNGQSIRSLGDFAKEAYSRVEDMFAYKDFDNCERFVMVGCGPLPVTLLHVAERYPLMAIEGLDVDEDAVVVARKVAHTIGASRVNVSQGDGVSYSYAAANIVYIANLVSPKAEVLARISATAPLGALIVLRDPTQEGAHWAEVGLAAVDARFHVEGEGEGSRLFQSRHVFLRLVARDCR